MILSIAIATMILFLSLTTIPIDCIHIYLPLLFIKQNDYCINFCINIQMQIQLIIMILQCINQIQVIITI